MNRYHILGLSELNFFFMASEVTDGRTFSFKFVFRYPPYSFFIAMIF